MHFSMNEEGTDRLGRLYQRAFLVPTVGKGTKVGL